MMLEEIEYVVEETNRGVWRRYLYPTGARFAEFKSYQTFLGWPLIHYTYGRCPETGRRIVAKGVIAVGRLAIGVIALGQASMGLVAFGQLAIGILFGLGQASTGIAAIGQLALGITFGLGQMATGTVAIGQVAVGEYVRGQLGFGKYVWSMKRTDPEAVRWFTSMFNLWTGR